MSEDRGPRLKNRTAKLSKDCVILFEKTQSCIGLHETQEEHWLDSSCQ